MEKKVYMFLLIMVVTISALAVRSLHYISNTTDNLSANTGFTVGEGGRIYKSTNGGAFWDSLNSGTPVDLNSVFMKSDSQVYVVGNNGLIRYTVNGGISWNSQTSNTSNNLNSIHFIDNSTGIVAGDNGTILLTTSNGAFWSSRPSGGLQNLNEVFFSDYTVNDIKGAIVGNNGKVLVSTDRGLNWTPTIGSPPSTNLTSVYIDSASGNSLFFVTGTDGRIYQTINGGNNWTTNFSPSPLFPLNSISFRTIVFPNRLGIVVGDSGVIYKTTNNGSTWSSRILWGGTNKLNSVCQFNSSIAWAAGDNNTILKTTNGGDNWTKYNFGELLTENFNYPAGSGDSLGAHGWVSFSGGNTNVLRVTSPGLIYPGYPLSNIGNATTLTTTGQDAYKDFTNPASTGSIYVSFMVKINSAATGDYFFAFLPPNSTSLYTSRFYAKDSTAGFSFGLSKSAGGITYTGDIYSYGTTYLVVLKYQFNTGTTTDDVMKAYIFSGSIPLNEPGTPTIGPVTGTVQDNTLGRVALRQGTTGLSPTVNIDGIRVTTHWLSDIATSVQYNPENISDDFYLSQNYPNPFNPGTTLSFNLHEKGLVKLIVYNSLGKEVATLVNENLNQGSYRVNFNGDKLPSGMYFYRLTAGQFSQTRKMVLVK